MRRNDHLCHDNYPKIGIGPQLPYVNSSCGGSLTSCKMYARHAHVTMYTFENFRFRSRDRSTVWPSPKRTKQIKVVKYGTKRTTHQKIFIRSLYDFVSVSRSGGVIFIGVGPRGSLSGYPNVASAIERKVIWLT